MCYESAVVMKMRRWTHTLHTGDEVVNANFIINTRLCFEKFVADQATQIHSSHASAYWMGECCVCAIEKESVSGRYLTETRKNVWIMQTVPLFEPATSCT